MIPFFTQNKRPRGMVGRRNLSMDGIHAACRGKILPGSVQYRMAAGFPASEGTQDLLTVYIPLLTLSH